MRPSLANAAKLKTPAILLFSIACLTLLTDCSGYSTFQLPRAARTGRSAPFTWEPRASPVIERGELSDVLNPSVIQFHEVYWNLYSEFDGKTWHTAAATSPDGIAWTKQGRVISPAGLETPSNWEGTYWAANGSLMDSGHEMLYWYQAGEPPRIGVARSEDGKNWKKEAQPVLPLGPRGSFDERGVADPNVIVAGGDLYMFYLGQDRAGQQRIGVAHSQDGVVWAKLSTNPILDLGAPHTFDEDGLGEPAVWSAAGQYWMLYTGRSRRVKQPDGSNPEPRRIGLAKSPDGIHWERVPNFVLNHPGPIAGDQAWDSQVVCDPSVEAMPDGSVRVWFGGGDVGSPDENLHGQIGTGTLKPRQSSTE